MSNISKINIKGENYDIRDNTAIHNVKTLGNETLEGTGNIDLKTINGISLLGRGDIQIQGGGGGTVDLSNYYTKNDIDSKNYATKNDISGKANSSDLAKVATSGNYGDLKDKPEFKTINGTTIIGTGNIELDNYPIVNMAGVMGKVEIHPNKYYICELVDASVEFDFKGKETSETVEEYIIELHCGGVTTDITFPSYFSWANPEPPEFSAGMSYIISVVNNLGVFVEF